MSATITPKKEPTASEAMFFFAIVKHTRNKADIDWAAVATEQGFKNADVAKVRFGQVKRKLGINDASGASRSPAAKTGVASGRVTKTPTKRGAAKSKKLKAEDEDDDDMALSTDGETKAPPMLETPKQEIDFPDAASFADL